MSKHTPGPWHALSNCEGDPLTRIGFTRLGVGDGYDSICIALLQHNGSSDAEISANATLIASAPNMLQALRRAVLALAFAAETFPAMRDDYEAVSAAIDQATGGVA
jgi:hypothetical protein